MFRKNIDDSTKIGFLPSLIVEKMVDAWKKFGHKIKLDEYSNEIFETLKHICRARIETITQKEIIFFPVCLHVHWWLFAAVHPNSDVPTPHKPTSDLDQSASTKIQPCILHMDSTNAHPRDDLYAYVSMIRFFVPPLYKRPESPSEAVF